ncbi:MAG: alpha/beta hydrolase [Bacteroidia bacterium]
MKRSNLYLTLALLFIAMTFWACQAEKITEPGHLVPLTVDENPNLPAIEINGTRLHAYAVGEPGNLVVITLHGGPGGDHLELKQFEVLADSGYRVVFWDQRGAGLSRRHNPEIYNEAIYLEDLLQLINYYTESPRKALSGAFMGCHVCDHVRE